MDALKVNPAQIGVEIPEKGSHIDKFADLDEDTREKAESLIDEAKEQLEQLGVEHLQFGRQNGSETN